MNKKEKGITLIALIITIIVLLVLAASTIGILTNQGILSRVSSARDTQVIEQEKEAIKLGYNEYQIAKHEKAAENPELKVENADVKGSEAKGGWTITFTNTTGNVYTLDENGNIDLVENNSEDEIARIKAGYEAYRNPQVNQEDLDLLTQYCIGNNDKDLMKDVIEIQDDNSGTFINRSPIPNASKELIYTDMKFVEGDEGYEILTYFNYKDNEYKLVSGWGYEMVDGSYSVKYPTKRVELNAVLGVEGASVEENDEEGWTITFTDTGNKYILNPDGTIDTAEGLYLNRNELSLGINAENNESETKEIRAGGAKGIIKWKIADKNVATINKSSGTSVKITAVGEGTTTVTATCGKYSDTCTVTVSKGFKHGNVLLKAGDYIAYDATKDANGKDIGTKSYTSDEEKNGFEDQTFKINQYKQGWRVLGVSNGKLELISENPVGSLDLAGNKGYIHACEELNAISAIYGKGKGAVGARSINVDDVNGITGYDPTNTGNGEPYDKDTVQEYGVDVTYYWYGGYQWSGHYTPKYTATNGKTGLLSDHSTFYWSDGDTLHHSTRTITEESSSEKEEKIITLKNTFYSYLSSSLTSDESTVGEKKGILENSNEYKVLFGQEYWLASRYVYCGVGSAWFGVRCCDKGVVKRFRRILL